MKNLFLPKGIFKKRNGTRFALLAEAIILQTIEDLWNKKHSSSCKNFFFGDDFDICAKMAGMNTIEQIRIRSFVTKCLSGLKKRNIIPLRRKA